MTTWVSIFLVFLYCLIFFMPADGQNILIASGAGYKKPVIELMTSFQAVSGIEVKGIFGNMQMVTNQAKQSGDISVIIGDKIFLKKQYQIITFSDYIYLGNGILVIAYRKGISLRKPEDIVLETIKSVFMPQDEKAIYGVAAKQTLQSYSFIPVINNKLTQVGTVPQIISYLLTGEADAGFINLTEAFANKDKLGGYIIIPEDKYTKIDIVAGVVENFESSVLVKRFLSFLQSDTAKEIFIKYGM